MSLGKKVIPKRGQPMRFPVLRSTIVILFAAGASRAGSIQFTLLYTSEVGMTQQWNQGIGVDTSTFVIENSGPSAFALSDVVFDANLVSTNAPATPSFFAFTILPNALLGPGEAIGYFNGNITTPPGTVSETLSYLNSYIAGATAFFAGQDYLDASVNNPPGSGVTFANTQTTIDYTLSVGSAEVMFSASFLTGQPSATLTVESSLSTVDGNYIAPPGLELLVPPVPVPEPSTVPLVACPLAAFMYVRFRRSKRCWVA
jgi:hypothetical protein